jgi:hypothetical protein
MHSSLRKRGRHESRAVRWVSRHNNDVQRLNDEFRQAGPIHNDDGHWLFTRGVTALGRKDELEAVRRVMRFDIFTEDNDPYCMHDFGAFELVGEKLFWKIDCFNRALDAASPDDADPAVTCRVLTIMLASEY